MTFFLKVAEIRGLEIYLHLSKFQAINMKRSKEKNAIQILSASLHPL